MLSRRIHCRHRHAEATTVIASGSVAIIIVAGSTLPIVATSGSAWVGCGEGGAREDGDRPRRGGWASQGPLLADPHNRGLVMVDPAHPRPAMVDLVCPRPSGGGSLVDPARLEAATLVDTADATPTVAPDRCCRHRREWGVGESWEGVRYWQKI